MTRVGLCCAAIMVLVPASSHAECQAAGALSSEFMLSFASDPKSLLELFPHGTRVMGFKVAEIAEASAKMAGPLRIVMRFANEPQSEAIGAGLARAAKECASESSELSSAITDLALHEGNQNVVRAFSQWSEDLDGSGDSDALHTQAVDGAGRDRFVPGVTLDLDKRTLPNPFAPLDQR